MPIKNQKLETVEVTAFQKVDHILFTFVSDVNIITGPNRAGKSSFINAIIAAIGGPTALKALNIAEPIQNGKEESIIKVETSDYTIIRTFKRLEDNKFSADLKFYYRDSESEIAKPQQTLNGLISLFLEPTTFLSMPEDKMRTVLLSHLGLQEEFNKITGQIKFKMDERATLNRRKKELEGQKAGLPEPEPNMDMQEVDIVALSNEINKIKSKEESLPAIERHANTLKEQKQNALKDMEDISKMIEEYRKKIKELETKNNELLKYVEEKDQELTAERTNYKKLLDEINSYDMETKSKELANAKSKNEAIANVKEYIAVDNLIGDIHVEAEKLTGIIEEKRKELSSLLVDVPMLEGLTFDENGLYYNEIPISQCSEEERISVASIFSMLTADNNKLDVIFIRNGNAYSKESLEKLIEIARENGKQLLIETVHQDVLEGKAYSIININGGNIHE